MRRDIRENVVLPVMTGYVILVMFNAHSLKYVNNTSHQCIDEFTIITTTDISGVTMG